MLKCFNDFQNQNFLALLLKWIQAVVMKRNISMTFIIGIFQFHCKDEDKQVKCTCKSDSILPYLQSIHYWNDFWNKEMTFKMIF